MQEHPPTLYSFRRCPYAMRARLALRYSMISVELREVDLKSKPADMLLVSPKATVPVLVFNDKKVIDESIDIMRWALSQNAPENWLNNLQHAEIDSLIQQNDSQFKNDLDHYKYADRFPQQSPLFYRQQGEIFLKHLEQQLNQHSFLTGNSASLADIALFPFIRQFAYVDIQWFETSPYPKLRHWLTNWLESELFISIMQKYPRWVKHQTPVIF